VTATFDMRKVTAVAIGTLSVCGMALLRVSPTLKVGAMGVVALGTALLVSQVQ
jgi:uncharacterized membrane protein